MLAANTTHLMSISDFHRRMGHINHDDLQKMVKEGRKRGRSRSQLETRFLPNLHQGKSHAKILSENEHKRKHQSLW